MAYIKTPLDNALEEDVALEMINNQPPAVATTLKNAENVYKSFLYLRKMYSLYPTTNQILKQGVVNNDDYVEIDKPEDANYIFVSNLSDDLSYFKLNGDEFAIAPNKDFMFPVKPKTDEDDGDKVELKGKVSYYLKISQEF